MIAKQHYADIVEAIGDLIRQGVPAWVRDGFWPKNIKTQERYDCVNPLCLNPKNRCSCWWGTREDWQTVGVSVPGDVTGTTVFRIQPSEMWTGSEIPRTFSLTATDEVFNAEQLGQNNWLAQKLDFNYRDGDALLKATGADIRYGPELVGAKLVHRSIYRRKEDYIRMPEKFVFQDECNFYLTFFHELAHWAEPRLNWTAVEPEAEMAAEIAAHIIQSELGFPVCRTDDEQLKRYRDDWLKLDVQGLFRATWQASRAANYLLDFAKKENDHAT